jgi:hypothetical protein
VGKPVRAGDALERDVDKPVATVPVVNPAAGAGGGSSWCVASPGASPTALQVALDFACGQGGADCSAIQQGGSCYSPSTVKDHASFAFNSYYQSNPVQTSCDFGGTAVLTSTNPSTLSLSLCQFSALQKALTSTTNQPCRHFDVPVSGNQVIL